MFSRAHTSYGWRFFAASAPTLEKIKAPPMVYIAGEEMTRWAGELYLNEWIRSVTNYAHANQLLAIIVLCDYYYGVGNIGFCGFVFVFWVLNFLFVQHHNIQPS